MIRYKYKSISKLISNSISCLTKLCVMVQYFIQCHRIKITNISNATMLPLKESILSSIQSLVEFHFYIMNWVMLIHVVNREEHLVEIVNFIYLLN